MNNYYYKYNHNDVICVHFKLKLAGYNHKQVAYLLYISAIISSSKFSNSLACASVRAICHFLVTITILIFSLRFKTVTRRTRTKRMLISITD